MTTTLAEAQDKVNTKKYERHGVVCPCCNQLAKVYKRKLNSALARALIALARRSLALGKKEGAATWPWIDKHDLPVIQGQRGGGDFAKLRYWKLIEQKPHLNDPTKRHSGYWRITELGMRFVKKMARLPSSALVYDEECEKLTGDYIGIEAALGKHFDYEELWTAAK